MPAYMLKMAEQRVFSSEDRSDNPISESNDTGEACLPNFHGIIDFVSLFLAYWNQNMRYIYL